MRGLIIILSVFFFLTGCDSHQLYESSDVPMSSGKDVTKSPVPIEFLGDNRPIKTLDMSGEAFNTVGEWFDNESILYVSDRGEGGSDIYRYNIYTGEKNLFITTSAPVITMKANEDHSLFFLHTSNSSNVAEIIIVDKDGNRRFEKKIASTDIIYSWNPYQNNQVFVTSFLEDWSFQTNLVDIQNGTMEKYNVPQPFIQWIDHSHISYLKWNPNELDFFAPLFTYDLKTKTEGPLFENIISFSTFNQLMVTIEVDMEHESFGIYRFYHTDSKKKLQEMRLPLLTDYSKWNIPFNEYVPSQQMYFTFRPYSTGSFDTYSEKYELVSKSMSSGKEEVILEKVNDEPISFSPDGYLALYGYRFENIIDIREKKIIPLIK
ncbi:hypothetical protein [Fredinandcohnia quinoae]|uniref:YqgU-like 6-bladed beta-propeller domain-containing protein n=1 Tax=Fredinandcohnia quinoae TaxID=2918902 RepID=A0AAW5E815_9BACI|nr:hypothetical protein [Fredinandcohnia sp. SECRCQ15]MCH1624924.1 hypothetical protein [Fredinandcohnia sp. SECRCQ15]